MPEIPGPEENVIVVIGDSIASHLTNFAFDAASTSTVLEDFFPDNPSGDPVQLINTAVGGNTTAQIRHRFDHDCLRYNPDIAIINGGTNDLRHGNVIQEDYIDAWRSILDACSNNGVVAVVLGVVPCTALSNDRMRERDRWNAALKSLVESYNGFIYCDADSYVGQFRDGGDPGNLWDIQPDLDIGDGVHFMQAGYNLIALALLDSMEPLKHR
jgi:lysophospholipase L1-like esterase